MVTKKDIEWAQEQIMQYKTLYPKYERYAETLQKVLKKVTQTYAPLAIVQTRPKSVASFGEKIWRKKAKYRDPVNQITDLCGGRVITPTRSELKRVREYIEGHFDIDWANSLDVSELMEATEFGYRSFHYIVQFKPELMSMEDVAIPKEILDLKAEIQVRTILEHAWALFSHDRSYKSSFTIPKKWERELAGVAAVLERADNAFSSIQTGLQIYASSYGAYMTQEQMQEEIRKLEIVLKSDTENVELAHRIGKLTITLGEWEKAIDVLSKYAYSDYQPLIKDLGVALCKQYEENRESDEYRQGQRYLKAASAPPNKDVDALASLAGTWKGIDEDKARKLYKRAFEIDPSNPYPLGNYLEYEIKYRQDASLVSLMKPIIDAAIQRCRDQVDVGVNLPWAFYDIGKFYLLLGRSFASLSAYAKAIQLSIDDWMIETSLSSLDKLEVIRNELHGYEWSRRLLVAGWAAKFRTPDAMKAVKELASADQGVIQGSVIIVAGGCDPNVEQKMQGYGEMLLEVFRAFKGTIISGGTTSGVSGLVGSVQEKNPQTIHTIGYLPKRLPKDAIIDGRYSEIRYTDGDGFSALEPLQMWIDLIASGISPDQVKLLAINGGAITMAECRIAQALGACVAVIGGGERETEMFFQDDDRGTSRVRAKLIRLPPDAVMLRVFIGGGGPKLQDDIRRTIGRVVHENYRKTRANSGLAQDPSLANWDALREDLKESNMQQVDHTFEKLQQIGCTVQEVKDRPIALMTFTDSEVETMAEMEHARWMVERLLDGWIQGEQRDVANKTSPYLVCWSELPENVKEWDREVVRKIPELLVHIELEIHRQA